MAKKKAPVHIGFAKLEARLAAKGVPDPADVAGAIGRKKYGKAGMAALSAAGRKKAARRKKGKR